MNSCRKKTKIILKTKYNIMKKKLSNLIKISMITTTILNVIQTNI